MGKEGEGGGSSNQQGRKNKGKGRMNYLKQVRKGRGGGGGSLSPGMKGFILTTNFREKECVKEGYNLLEEYYYRDKEGEGGKKVKDDEDTEQGPGSVEEEEEEDIDKALAKEVSELKGKEGKKFQVVDTGVPNVIFMKTTIDDPSDLVYQIFSDIVEKKQSKSRNILRFVPIQGTCHNDEQSIRSLAESLLSPHFKPGLKTYKIIVNLRYTQTKSKFLIDLLAKMVHEINPLNVVSLNDHEFTILVEVMKNVVCLSVLKDYTKYKKFNIAEIVSPSQNNEKKAKEAQKYPGESSGTSEKPSDEKGEGVSSATAHSQEATKPTE